MTGLDRIRTGYAATAVLWCTAVLSTPILVGSGREACRAVAAATYVVGSSVCHQLPARSLSMAGVTFPVCARCTGIYVSAALVALVLAWAPRPLSRKIGAPTITSRDRLVVAAIAAAPSLATVAYEWLASSTPSNGWRFLAGLPLGALVSWLIASPEPEQYSG